MTTIHRIWIGGQMPPEFQSFGEKWAKLNPDHTVKDWSQEELFDHKWINQRVIDKMHSESRQPGADMIAYYTHLADVMCYELLYNYGGWYFNTDMVPVRPLSTLWDKYPSAKAGMALEDGVHSVNMAMYAPGPGHPFFKAVIDELPRRYFSMPGAFMNATTGALLTTPLANNRNDVCAYETKVFNPYHFTFFGYGEKLRYTELDIPEETLAVHLWGHRTNQRGQRILESGW
jgi:mannosyltransferase OCH1-like enzyme